MIEEEYKGHRLTVIPLSDGGYQVEIVAIGGGKRGKPFLTERHKEVSDAAARLILDRGIRA